MLIRSLAPSTREAESAVIPKPEVFTKLRRCIGAFYRAGKQQPRPETWRRYAHPRGLQARAGCARSRILTDSDDQNVLIIASEWQDAAAADAFFNSREFQIFKGIRMLMRDEPYIVMDEVRARVTRLMRAS